MARIKNDILIEPTIQRAATDSKRAIRGIPGAVIVVLVAIVVSSDSAEAVFDPEYQMILHDVIDENSGDFRAILRAYSPSSPREFSNGALVDTRILIPEDAPVHVDHFGELAFPKGTLLVKRFSYRTQKEVRANRSCDEVIVDLAPTAESSGQSRNRICELELRVLKRTVDGWKAFVFEKRDGIWDHRPAGKQVRILTGIDGRSIDYSIPGIAECAECHQGSRNRSFFGPISMTTRRLSRETLRDITRVSARSDEAVLTPEDRGEMPAARAYLDVNCGYCHNPNGLAASSGLNLDSHETDEFRLGICKRPIAFNRMPPGSEFVIDLDNPVRSLLLHRMASLDPAIAMPELGRSLVDVDGIALVLDWIRGVDGVCAPIRELDTVE